MLDVGAKRVTDAGLDRVGSLSRIFGYRITGIVHDIGVVAVAAN